MSSQISLINPVRIGDAMPDFSNAQQRILDGWDINLALDLNIITKMEKCVFDKSTLEQVGLTSLVDLLKNDNVVLVPGFAFSEVKTEFAARARGAYEAFALKYLTGYTDALEAILSPNRDITNTREYFDASHSKRQVFARTYIGMLLLFIVNRRIDLGPNEKFQLYINRLAYCTGEIGVVEARTAQFIFYDRSKVTNAEWSKFCGSIRDNFLKSGGSKKKVRLNSFNQAHDLGLVKNAALVHGHTIGGRRIDYWIAAEDAGLVNLCSTFHFNIGKDGFYTGEFVCTDGLFSELRSDLFWKTTQDFWHGRIEERARDREHGAVHELEFQQLEANIRVLHAEVDALPYPPLVRPR